MGLGVIKCDAEALQRELELYRNAHPEWEELQNFYFVKETETELHIFRARNTPPVKTKGDYRPLED